jgi:serine/threonine-protein kinase
MSKFYMARDRKLERVVGLKIADRDKLAVFEARFKGLKKPSEGEIAAGMHHPLVVETYEHGTTHDGLPFIVMEYVRGPGLHQLLYNRDRCLEGQRLRLVRQMAEAVEYVHSRQFIHRDVCPRNFIYEADTGNIKLIDFGLSVPMLPEFMQPGNRTGTPLYMAPELVRRRATDQRLDVFAMGVSAYQICTYELPWPVTDTTGQAALAHDTQLPRDVLEYRPTLNRTLAKAIMRCLRPNPHERPATVGEFLRAIRAVEADDE